jgi:succinate-semialdehyde dehydrogenase
MNENIIRMVEKARIAQKIFENSTQEEVDIIVREVGKVVYDNAEELAKMAVEETGMGVYEDKVIKNKGKAKVIWDDLNGKKSVGIIGRDLKSGIVKIAKPIGVIGSVTPTTNPIVTPMSNIMFALKGRNAIIVAPHPRSKVCSTKTVDLINNALKNFDIPENLIQVIRKPSIEKTNELMVNADVAIATGGASMVKAAYSSGKPAFGVGPGNVQCVVDDSADLDKTAQKIIRGRSFDNGIICSGEQTVSATENIYEELIRSFEKNGGYLVRDVEKKEKLRNLLFPNNLMNKDIVGHSAEFLAEKIGIKVHEKTKVLMVEPDGPGKLDLFCKEKMCPVLSLFKCENFEKAVINAQTNLDMEGKGHTAVIHSEIPEHIEYVGINLTVSRIVVNQSSSITAGGSLNNGFAPTATLGCGTWGNNSISENFTYKHMINISQLGYYLDDIKIPTDDEIWSK